MGIQVSKGDQVKAAQSTTMAEPFLQLAVCSCETKQKAELAVLPLQRAWVLALGAAGQPKVERFTTRQMDLSLPPTAVSESITRLEAPMDQEARWTPLQAEQQAAGPYLTPT